MAAGPFSVPAQPPPRPRPARPLGRPRRGAPLPGAAPPHPRPELRPCSAGPRRARPRTTSLSGSTCILGRRNGACVFKRRRIYYDDLCNFILKWDFFLPEFSNRFWFNAKPFVGKTNSSEWVFFTPISAFMSGTNPRVAPCRKQILQNSVWA